MAANRKSTGDSIALPYGLVPNALPEVDGYHAVHSHAGTTDAQTLYSRTAARLPGCSASTVELTLNGAFAVAAQLLSERQYRIALENVTFELAIPGSGTAANELPSEKPQIVVYPSDSLKNAAVGLDTSYVGDGGKTPVLRMVEDLTHKRQDQVPASGLFRLGGVEMSALRPDETIKVVSGKGTEASATVVEDKGLGTSVTARIDSQLPAGPATVVFVTHGRDTPESKLLTLTKKTVVVTDPEPVPPVEGPEIERGYSVGHGEGEDDGKVFPGTGFELIGSGFANALVTITYMIAGQPSDVDVDPEDMTVTDTGVTIDAASPALQEAIQATGTLTFTVTTSAGSDTYDAVVME